MVKPIRLFGIEQKDQKVYFVNNDGLGFWFTSIGERTVGESELLKPISDKIEQYDAANNRLILEIIHQNKESLTAELKEKNPNSLSPQQLVGLKGRDLTFAVESYVRTLINDLEFSHPAIYPFVEKITSFSTSSLMLEYQLACVRVAFLKRYVNKPEIVIPTSEDPEIGYLPLKSIIEGGLVGINPDEFNDDDLGEVLALKIYRFLQDDFRGVQWKTTKILAAEDEKQKLEATTQATNSSVESTSEVGNEPVKNNSQEQTTTQASIGTPSSVNSNATDATTQDSTTKTLVINPSA